MRRGWIVGLASALAAAGFLAAEGPEEALESITERDLHAHMRFLADDALEGRAPATDGDRLTQLYLSTRFERLGLEAPYDGGHLQPVPLVGRTTDSTRVALAAAVAEGRVPIGHPTDAVVWTGTADATVEVSSELVFVGYGVEAPEYGWDDFGGRDLEGKILLVLINDPPAPPEESELFGGRAMTYYGRWTYKLEEARRQGAAGALIIHSTGAAGYPWSVVQSSWTGERFTLPREADAPPPLALEGWIQRDAARDLLDRAGINLDELYVRAARRDFMPIETGVTLDATIRSDIRRVQTANVVARLPGTDEELADEPVVLTAHHDHLGIGRPSDGDSIYNGAFDNASGVALLLEVAEAFSRLDPRPRRSILFLATGAEESGLLGSEHYVRNALTPIGRTAAAINVDGANIWGETDDIVALGMEQSTLGRIADQRAAGLGLRVVRDRAPEKGFFFRSDHFSFARAGVPVLHVEHGVEFRDPPDDQRSGRLGDYDAGRYHRPDDEYRRDMDLGGAVQQARLVFLIAYDVAQADSAPRWHDDPGLGAVPPRPATPPR